MGAGMGTKENLEIYQQRYNTFRHLDSLRWQMLQTALATSGVVLAFGKDSNLANNSWPWIVVGIILTILGGARLRMDFGVADNGRALTKASEAIGDKNIPAPGIWHKSISVWISLLMICVGLITIGITPWR